MFAKKLSVMLWVSTIVTTTLLSMPTLAASRFFVNYQGRVVKPDGNALTQAAVPFNIKVKTPDGSCTLYEENQVVNVTDGFFQFQIGSGTRADAGAHTFSSVFMTGYSYSTTCPAYTAVSSDDRKVYITFTVGSDTIALDPQMIKAVPFAYESYTASYSGDASKVGGVASGDVLTVSGATAASLSTPRNFSQTDFVKLVNMISGTSNAQTPVGLGTYTNAQQGAATFSPGQMWYNSTTGTINYYDGAIKSVGSGGSLPSQTGNSGKYLTTDGTNASWATVSGSGTVTSVSGTSPISVATGTSTPVISINAGTTTGQALRWNGTNWAAGFIALTDLRSTVTGTNTFATSCGANQTLTYNSVGDVMSCASIAISASQVSGVVVNGGQTGAVTVGTADATSLTFNTNASPRVTVLSGGNVGIGATSPTSKLELSGGQMRMTASYAAGAVTAFDWDNGNQQYTTSSCQAMTFTNMKDGGTYTLVVKGTTSGTCTFTQAGLTFKFLPANGPTVSGQQSIYNFVVAGTDVYVSWASGY